MNWTRIAYWAATLLIAAMMLLSSFAYFSGVEQVRNTVTHLGYPLYLLWILGSAKLLGTLALVQGHWPTLREWAYAGFTFDLIGATASHLFADDPVSQAAIPASLLAPLAVSYALRPSRSEG